MTTPDEREAIARIEQCDRDAAADFYRQHLARPNEVPVEQAMRVGHIDESPLIQAFAKHRILATRGDRFAEGVSDELLAFLHGSGPLDGKWFGDKDERGRAFWWREHLPAIRSLKAPEAGGCQDLVVAALAVCHSANDGCRDDGQVFVAGDELAALNRALDAIDADGHGSGAGE